MQNASVANRLDLNLGSAAIHALNYGKEVKLSLCPKSAGSTAVFRIVKDNGKPDYNHPVIAEICAYIASKSNHVTAHENTLNSK